RFVIAFTMLRHAENDFGTPARVRFAAQCETDRQSAAARGAFAAQPSKRLPATGPSSAFTLLCRRRSINALLALRRQLFLLLSLTRPQSLGVHGIEQDRCGNRCDAERPPWGEAQQQGRCGDDAYVEAPEQVGY